MKLAIIISAGVFMSVVTMGAIGTANAQDKPITNAGAQWPTKPVFTTGGEGAAKEAFQWPKDSNGKIAAKEALQWPKGTPPSGKFTTGGEGVGKEALQWPKKK